MSMFLAGLVVALVVALGAGALMRKPRQLTAGDAWGPAIDEAARSLGGRATTGSDRQLRAEHLDLTVTVKWSGDELLAEGALRPGSSGARIFLVSGAAKGPQEIDHYREVTLPPAFSLDPPVSLRSDEPATALAFADRAAGELAPLIAEARARGLYLLARGGTLRLVVVGARPSAAVIEKVVQGTARLADSLGGNRALAAVATKHIPVPEAPRVTCALCGGEQRPDVAWVRCSRCGSAHHAECWDSAKACAKAGCGGMAAEAMA